MRKGEALPSWGLPGGQYRPLTDVEVTRIHRAALAILADDHTLDN